MIFEYMNNQKAKFKVEIVDIFKVSSCATRFVALLMLSVKR